MAVAVSAREALAQGCAEYSQEIVRAAILKNVILWLDDRRLSTIDRNSPSGTHAKLVPPAGLAASGAGQRRRALGLLNFALDVGRSIEIHPDGALYVVRGCLEHVDICAGRLHCGPGQRSNHKDGAPTLYQLHEFLSQNTATASPANQS